MRDTRLLFGEIQMKLKELNLMLGNKNIDMSDSIQEMIERLSYIKLF